MRPGIWEILLVIVLILILFGHNKIPGMMKNLANGINVFKKEIKDKDSEVKKVLEKKGASAKKKVSVKKKVVKK